MANLLGLLWFITMGSTFVGQRAALALADQYSPNPDGQRWAVTGPAILRTVGDIIFTLIGMTLIYIFLPQPFSEVITGVSLGGYLLHNVKMALQANAARSILEAEVVLRARSTMATHSPTSLDPIESPASSNPLIVSDRATKNPPQAMALPIPPPTLTTLRRKVIPSGDASSVAPGPDMVYDEDEDWAYFITDEDDKRDAAGLPPLDLYNDAQVQRLREILQGQLQNYMRAYQQGFFRDVALHEQWLDNRPELAKYLTWYRSKDSADARMMTMDDGDKLLERYLFWQWV